MYQPDRMKNVKTSLLLVSLSNPNDAANQPGCVRTNDASTITGKPPAIPESGSFYALWDCYHMYHNTSANAHVLVELREMVPVPGRVWQNWYNWTGWKGWTCVASPLANDLHAVSSEGDMDGYLTTVNGSDQLFGIGCKIVNANNTSYKNHRLSLIATNTGINLYDHTTGTWVWANH